MKTLRKPYYFKLIFICSCVGYSKEFFEARYLRSETINFNFVPKNIFFIYLHINPTIILLKKQQISRPYYGLVRYILCYFILDLTETFLTINYFLITKEIVPKCQLVF